ncbi:unnamed protein product [Rhizopus microsporus]
MSVSVFLDTLRKHDLDQFYSTFSTHGITHLQSLAQLSLQDYSRLGITNTADRRKIFGLVQSIRKDNENKTNNMMTTSTSTMTSGLRQPQTYSNSSNSRLPQPDSISRTRRQSIIDKPTPPPSIMTANVGERHIRSRTMSMLLDLIFNNFVHHSRIDGWIYASHYYLISQMIRIRRRSWKQRIENTGHPHHYWTHTVYLSHQLKQPHPFDPLQHNSRIRLLIYHKVI